MGSAWTSLVTQTPLTFFPTLTGPDVDFLMTCTVNPPAGVTGDFLVTWVVDGKDVATEKLTPGVTSAIKSLHHLPKTGDLKCKVELDGASALSSPVDLAAI